MHAHAHDTAWISPIFALDEHGPYRPPHEQPTTMSETELDRSSCCQMLWIDISAIVADHRPCDGEFHRARFPGIQAVCRGDSLAHSSNPPTSERSCDSDERLIWPSRVPVLPSRRLRRDARPYRRRRERGSRPAEASTSWAPSRRGAQRSELATTRRPGTRRIGTRASANVG